MMFTFETTDLGKDYPDLLAKVMHFGALVKPRGELIREVRPLILRLEFPERCIVQRPGFSRALMWLEVLSLLSGEFDRSLFEVVSPDAAKRLNAYGAYGPRVKEQLLEAERELRRDPDSRRALVYVGRPDDLRLSLELEMPCTATWQFFKRDGKLEMIVNMRSWDLVWGLSYDVPCFVAMQWAMASALRIPMGTYTHIAGSGHIYERHFELAPGANIADSFELPFGIYSIAQWQNEAHTTLDAVRAAAKPNGSFYVPSSWVPQARAIIKKLRKE